jgi:hypothetical protein
MDWNPTFFVEIVWNKENQKVVHLLRIKKMMIMHNYL